MGFLDRLKKLFQEKDSAEEVVHELTKSYKRKKELGLKDPIDTTVDRIMELIYESKDPNDTAERILKAAIEEEQMPNRISEKVSIKISQADDIKDEVISNAIAQSEVDVPDAFIDRVIEEGDLALEHRLKLMRNVTDEAIVENRVTQEFNELYNSVSRLNDFSIVSRVTRMREIVEDSNSDMDVTPYIERVFARKIAENFYNDSIRGTKLYAFSTVIPFNKLFADDLPTLTEGEFKSIEEERGRKPGRYKKEVLRKQLLDEIGKAVGTRYKETKDSRDSKRFIVPRSRMMEAISPEELQALLRTIQIYSDKQLTKKDIKSITEQVTGKISNNSTRASLIVAAMEKMPDIDEGVKSVTEIMSDSTKLETLFYMEKLGLLDRFSSMSPERREKSLNIISETLANRAKQKQQEENKENSGQEQVIKGTAPEEKEER